MSTVVFTFRPRPLIQESFRGYLLRLTGSNGYKSVSDRLSLLGFTTLLFRLHPKTKLATEIYPVLAPLLRLDADTFSKAFTHQPLSSMFSSYDRWISNLLTVHCRVCVDCLKEDKAYHRSSWDMAPNVYCDQHHCYLTEHCPHCGEPISWSRKRINQCHHCRKPFSTGQSVAVSKDSAVAKASRMITRHGSLYLDALLNAIARMYRPGDNILAKPALEQFSIQDMIPLLEQAVGLLHSQSFRDQYLDWLQGNRSHLSSISVQAVAWPYLQIEEAIREYKRNELSHIAFKPPVVENIITPAGQKPVGLAKSLGIDAARLKQLNPKSSTLNLSTQIDMPSLTTLLSKEMRQIRRQVENGVFTSLNTAHYSHHMYFDLDTISTLKNI